jgi:hypothetical protein
MDNIKDKFKQIYFIGRYPETDWRRLFVLFTIVGILIGGWSVYTFFSVKNEQFVLENGNVSGRVAADSKAKELHTVIETYETKQARYEQLRSGLPVITIVSTSTATSSIGGAATSTR